MGNRMLLLLLLLLPRACSHAQAAVPCCTELRSHILAHLCPPQPLTPLLIFSPQVNKGKLWDSTQVDEGLPQTWVDLNR